MIERDVRRFRVECVRETTSQARAILEAYADLLAGRGSPSRALARAGSTSQVGVLSAPMNVMS